MKIQSMWLWSPADVSGLCSSVTWPSPRRNCGCILRNRAGLWRQVWLTRHASNNQTAHGTADAAATRGRAWLSYDRETSGGESWKWSRTEVEQEVFIECCLSLVQKTTGSSWTSSVRTLFSGLFSSNKWLFIILPLCSSLDGWQCLSCLFRMLQES